MHIPIQRSTLALFGQFIAHLAGWGLGTGFFVLLFFQDRLAVIWVPWTILVVGVAAYLTGADAVTAECQQRLLVEEDAKRTQALMQDTLEDTETLLERARNDAEVYRNSLAERNRGFPTLMGAISEYAEQKDRSVAAYLASKIHPARRSAEMVKEEADRRRQAEHEYRQTKAIIDYYEIIAPFLVDLKEDIEIPSDDLLAEYDEEERADAVTAFLTKEEYRKLSATQRNQMALDRFWARPKPRWLIGRLYERYLGYLYEQHGYDVEYFGIFKGYEDLGRDLICKKRKEIVVVQCKNWSQFRTIYEKHIFQFFGTVFQYKDANPGRKVRGVFCCATHLSDLARRFAAELGIELFEDLPLLTTYPCIKCNISRVDGELIYHLPFDQQYDTVKIEPRRGEFYCQTVEEAETQGFRRAYRHRSNADSGVI